MNKIIYEPTGKAREYGKYAVNLFRGCTHFCSYCFCPAILHMTREVFHSSCTAAPDVLARLHADMKRVGILPEPIFLCFTCDPYCVDAPEGITREAIKIILASGNRVNILTKSEWSCLDFDLLASVPGNKFGMTLTFIDPGLSIVWEPAATLPEYRIKTLAAAKYVGIETWASIEPVIIPSESLSIMKAALPYVDEYKIGMWNHDPRAKDIDWRDFKIRAQGIMELHGKRYMFKRELLKKYREEPPWNLPTGANSMRHAQGSGPGPSTT